MKVQTFYCEHKKTLFGKSAEETALDYTLKTIQEHYNNGLLYKCNMDSYVEIKPGCFRRIVRFFRKKSKEKPIIIKFTYAIFEEFADSKEKNVEFISLDPILGDYSRGVFDKGDKVKAYMKAGHSSIESFLESNKNIIPYCNARVMVRVKPGCFLQIIYKIIGKGYKNVFCFKYFDHNIAIKRK